MILPESLEAIPQPGYIYLIRLDSIFKTEYKIGKTRDLKSRINTLQCQTGFKAIPIAYGFSKNYSFAEQQILDSYYDQCVHGEFFSFNCGQLWHVIKTIEGYCGSVVTDYNTPECQYDSTPLVCRWNTQTFRCPICGNIISFDQYLSGYVRMLPYACDELNHDDGMYINDKYNAVYNWGKT